MTEPSSQRAVDRPISFVLHDKAAGARPVAVNLSIRPEDLTRSTPSRLNIQQTLSQDAWADTSGPGLTTITIAGHTGWRPGANDDKDGIERFISLRKQVFEDWHLRRDVALSSGIDPSGPNGVELIFSDALDQCSEVVAPQTFVLRRSKSRPLLCQYQIVMTVLSEVIGGANAAGSGSTPEAKKLTGLASLVASIKKLVAFIGKIKSFIDKNILGPIRAFVQQATNLFNAVKDAVQEVRGVFESIRSVATQVAQAGANLFHTLAMVANLPSMIKAELMGVGAAFTNIFCVLKNAINPQNTYEDYTGLRGASNCSSTAGGSPLSSFADKNPFFSVAPTASQPIASLSNAGRDGLNTLSQSDPILAPLTPEQLKNAVSAAGSGLVVA